MVNLEKRPIGIEGDEGGGADHDQRGRLADGARDRQDGAGQDAGHGVGQHMVPDRLPLGGAQPVAGLAQRVGHGADGFLGVDDDQRQDQQRQGQPGGEDGAPVGGRRVADPKMAPLVRGSSARTKIASPSMP